MNFYTNCLTLYNMIHIHVNSLAKLVLFTCRVNQFIMPPTALEVCNE